MKKILISFIASISLLNCIYAQSVNVADLQQDLDLLRREVGKLRLEVEELNRQNTTLTAKIRSLDSTLASNDAIKSQLSGVRASVNSQNETLKKEIIALVKKDMQDMASQMNTSMSKMATAINSTPKAEVQKTFSNDYPTSGIPYVVQSGDTLSKIAQKNNSKILWIQNANRIVNPSRDLQVGMEIFVPQK